MTINELHQHTIDLLAAGIKNIEKEELNSNDIPKEEEKTKNNPQKVKVRFIKKINP